MQHPDFESETSFNQGESDRGRWQSRRHYQQTHQGYQESYAYAQANALGNAEDCQVTTETSIQNGIIFQVSPDGTVRIIQPLSSHTYSSSRSGF